MTLEKGYWKSNEIHAARCLGFHVDGNQITADVRKTSKRALYKFLLKVAPEYAKGQGRKEVFPYIKRDYDELKKHFEDLYSANGQEILRDYQKEAVFSMLLRRANLLAFEQGLGKTITSLILDQLSSSERTLIICPSIAKWNWYREMFEKWGYNPMNITILDRRADRSYKSLDEKFIILNFEMLDKFRDYIDKETIDHVIIDECHKIKNDKTNKHKSIDKLMKAHGEPRITLLTGTPITNVVTDLIGYLKISRNYLGKSKAKFEKAYTRRSGGRFKKVIGTKNGDDLKLKLENFLIRKKTEDVIDLPPLLPQKFYMKVDISGQDYEEVMESMEELEKNDEQIDEKIREVKNSNLPLEKKRKQVNELYAEKNKTSAKKKGNIHSINRITSERKVPGVINMTDNILEQGEKVVIFTPYTSPLRKLKEHYGDKAVTVDGSVDSYERSQREKRFKEDPNVKVFIANVVAGGVAINLVNSNDVIFLGMPFTPDNIEQPMKRLHRIGQDKPVRVFFTIAEDTIDEYIYDMVGAKAEDISSLLDSNSKGTISYQNIEEKVWDKMKNKRVTA